MPRYKYAAKTQPLQTIQGDIEAQTKQEAVNKLTKMGYFPLEVKLDDSIGKPVDFSLSGKIPPKDIASFTRQLFSLIESGINLVNALNVVSRQTKNKRLHIILEDVISKIKDGSSFSEGLSRHTNVFSNLYISMINAAWASGNLKEALSRLANFLEKSEEFKDSLRSALIYPCFILTVGLATIFVLLVFVIPRLVEMFSDMGQALPLPTKILINLSGFLEAWWWLLAMFIFILVFFIRRFYHNPNGRVYLDKIFLKLFIVGPLILKSQVSHLARMLSLLISSGITINPALEVSTSILGNQVLRSEIQRFKLEIANGASLSACLKGSQFFPEFVADLVSIGEETGALDKALARAADDYEKDVERALKDLTRLLEPVIILFMGALVSFIVLAMLLPIFQINLIVR